MLDTQTGSSSNASSAPLSSEIRYFQGGLTADNFDFGDDLASFANQKIVVSGNGNIDYGNEVYDTLDFSAFSIDQATQFSQAEINQGGIVFDPGNGDRLFDNLTLDNGSQILFEGIDRIVFSDRTIDLTVTPDDPAYSQQWNLHMMGVQNAWRFTTGTEDVLLGIQDSGLGVKQTYIHPDLRIGYYTTGNLGDDFLNNSQSTDGGVQDNSHGTEVQGIIAANGDNAEGIAGINWNSEVYPIDVIDNNPGDLGFIAATQAMIDVAEEQDQHLVINLSLSVDQLSTSGEELQQMIVTNPDVLFVVAAGNDGHLGQAGLASPANLANYYDNVIAVGASWGNEDVNGTSTIPGTRIEYEQVWGSQYGDGLTITAPSEVLTTNAPRDDDFNYEPKFNGTSAAAPHVSGVASLIWSANPNLTAIEIKDIISETAYDLGAEGYDPEYGYGFINADAAVRRAIALGQESNDAGDISSDIETRTRAMLEYFQSQFPDVNLDSYFDFYDSNVNEATESDYQSQDVDPLTGSSTENSHIQDLELLTADNFSATDSNSVDLQLLKASTNSNLEFNTTNSSNNHVFDLTGSVENDFWRGVQDGDFGSFNSTKAF